MASPKWGRDGTLTPQRLEPGKAGSICHTGQKQHGDERVMEGLLASDRFLEKMMNHATFSDFGSKVDLPQGIVYGSGCVISSA